MATARPRVRFQYCKLQIAICTLASTVLPVGLWYLAIDTTGWVKTTHGVVISLPMAMVGHLLMGAFFIIQGISRLNRSDDK